MDETEFNRRFDERLTARLQRMGIDDTTPEGLFATREGFRTINRIVQAQERREGWPGRVLTGALTALGGNGLWALTAALAYIAWQIIKIYILAK